MCLKSDNLNIEDAIVSVSKDSKYVAILCNPLQKLKIFKVDQSFDNDAAMFNLLNDIKNDNPCMIYDHKSDFSRSHVRFGYFLEEKNCFSKNLVLFGDEGFVVLSLKSSANKQMKETHLRWTI